VRRVIEPLLAGDVEFDPTYDDDMSYVQDLGLITRDPNPAIANPVYREVIVRVLTAGAQAGVVTHPQSFILPDGRFDLPKMLREFSDFWREHGESLVGKQPYSEVAPQLVLMAYLQRVVNGGGQIEREYGVGRGRIDLLVRWPLPSSGALQREVLELKVWRDKKAHPLADGARADRRVPRGPRSRRWRAGGV